MCVSRVYICGNPWNVSVLYHKTSGFSIIKFQPFFAGIIFLRQAAPAGEGRCGAFLKGAIHVQQELPGVPEEPVVQVEQLVTAEQLARMTYTDSSLGELKWTLTEASVD